jgi:hypothetical protein
MAEQKDVDARDERGHDNNFGIVPSAACAKVPDQQRSIVCRAAPGTLPL